MKVLFVAGFGPIVPDPLTARRFYSDALGLSFQEGDDGYLYKTDLEGVKHFALWPLSAAARSCFGTEEWPSDVPEPQGWLEFDVDDLAEATEALKARGYRLLVSAQEEPWGQTVTRLLGPEGLLVGMTYTPFLRDGDESAPADQAGGAGE